MSDASAVAKVKLDIHNKESYMEKQFTELGRAYYLAHKNEENIPEKEFSDRSQRQKQRSRDCRNS